MTLSSQVPWLVLEGFPFVDRYGVRVLTSMFWTLDDLRPEKGIVREVHAQIWYALFPCVHRSHNSNRKR